MEAQEAGIDPWPQLALRPSTQFIVSDSNSEPESSNEYANESQVQEFTPTPASRPKIRDEKATRSEEKKKRKRAREEVRTAKAARRARREAIAKAKLSHEHAGSRSKGGPSTLVPLSSAQETEPISSFPPTSPAEEVEQDEVDNVLADESGSKEPQLRSSSPTHQGQEDPEAGQATEKNTDKTAQNYMLNKPKSYKVDKGKKPMKPQGGEVDVQNDLPSTSVISTTSTSKAVKPKAAKAKPTPVKRKRTPNAEAGPSNTTVAPETEDATTTTPGRQSVGRRPRSSATPGLTRSEAPENDETLRHRLSDPGAAQEFLISKYHTPPYLSRLEEAGIITVKKGKLSGEELRALKRHMEIFMRSNHMDQEQLVEVIMAKARSSKARESYPSFWQDVAMQIPGRPLRTVVKQVQRIYDTRGRKGLWTPEEDRTLRRSYEIHPGMWTKIAAIIERTEQDCRDRWNKELAHNDVRNSGPWTGEEEKSLRKAIEEANLAIGAEALSPEAPWEVVSAKMGHTRTSTQCRVKWRREMYPVIAGPGFRRQSMTPGRKSPNIKSKPTAPTKAAEGRHKRGAKSVVVELKTKSPKKNYKSQDIVEDSESDHEKEPDEKGGEESEDEVQDYDDEEA